jgi:hypothetical protein
MRNLELKVTKYFLMGSRSACSPAERHYILFSLAVEGDVVSVFQGYSSYKYP